MIFLCLNQNIVLGIQKNRLNKTEHPKHMLKLTGKKIFTILRSKKFVYPNLCEFKGI